MEEYLKKGGKITKVPSSSDKKLNPNNRKNVRPLNDDIPEEHYIISKPQGIWDYK